MVKIAILLALVGCSQAIFFGGPSWDGLATTWGPNPFSSVYFAQMPRTEQEAISGGWTKMADCSESGFYRGKQYMQNGDTAVVLLYGANGYIAGIQVGVPVKNNWPTQDMQYKSNFNYDVATNSMVMTAYFVPPREICSGGRTSQRFDEEGTGSNLYLQQGPDPVTDSVMIPRMEQDIGNTNWVKGGCFPTMGRHYWYELSKDMPINQFYPSFLLYNAGELNGFGWAIDSYIDSPRMEHPDPSVFGKFMSVVPDSVMKVTELSTLHIYMDDYPLLNVC